MVLFVGLKGSDYFREPVCSAAKIVQGECRATEKAQLFPGAMLSRSLSYVKIVQGECRATEKA